MAFFDLAQEVETLEDLYRVCVAVPKTFFGTETYLYLLDEKREALVLVCSTDHGYHGHIEDLPCASIQPRDEAFDEGSSLYFPIRGKTPLSEVGDEESHHTKLLGMLEVVPTGELGRNDRFYFQKFANRIGYSLYNKILNQRNIDHLKFINSLVVDIEHNVIVPNMAFRLFLRHLHAKIRKSREIEGMLREQFTELSGGKTVEENRRMQLLAELQEVNTGLMEEFNNIEQHYRNMSLFIESLFRRGHFKEGRFVPRKRSCNFKKEIINPQMERFQQRFQARGIEVDNQMGGVPDELVVALVDVGLMSQVYANLFSNALKYTRPVTDEWGRTHNFVSFGQELLRDHYGPGKDGIKFNVFSTGPHIPEEEREKIFTDGYRGSQVSDQPGTGHGLSFIKKVIEIHEGSVGYEPTPLGNNFYFILPI
jgi:signal transduction histidine kinase